MADPKFILVVIHPFADFQRGHQITDPGEIAEVLAGECAHHVHKTPVEGSPA
ncbi:hypothetical protein [Paludibacterium yongneupense]|uniref:hypothetical protein n=1 Tax=Paludibacterium yongneupense TaxID=400061 RepID=UPI000423DE81|nr:hypothetical protein [Paludibacterium yongneupense]